MDNKIRELTERIYHEGVEKGNFEAERIIEEAGKEKEKILSEAKKKATHIINEAEKKSEELKKNTKAELRLAGVQAVEALKTEITNLITGEICNSSVKAAFADKDFIQKVILSLVNGFGKKEYYTLQVANPEELKEYLESNTKGVIGKQVKIERVNGINTSFNLLPADGSYKVSFGEEEFINYFEEFLRPQVKMLLFDENTYE